jgi:hypothetical protein
MLRRRGDYSAADRFLSDVAKDVRYRLVPAWIKLSLERAKTLRKEDPARAGEIIREALEVTADLGLEQRTKDLRSLLAE